MTNMSDVPRQKLRDLIAQHGQSIGQQPQQCKGLLLDQCGEYRREISVLEGAAREGIPQALLASKSVPVLILVDRLTNQLQTNLALDAVAARWAVESWGIALGVLSASTRPQPATVPPSPVVNSAQPTGNFQPVANSGATAIPSPVVVSSGFKGWLPAIVLGSMIGALIVGSFLVVKSFQVAPSPSPIASPTSLPASNRPSPSPSPTPSSPTPPTPSPVVTIPPAPIPQPAASITQQEAVGLISNWLKGKQKIFAPPYNYELVEKLTTGPLYADLTRANGPVEWLKDNGAYYRFGVQRVDSVEQLSSQGNKASIKVWVTEERTLYKRDGSIDPNETDLETRLVLYSLERSQGQWKIADYTTLETR